MENPLVGNKLFSPNSPWQNAPQICGEPARFPTLVPSHFLGFKEKWEPFPQLRDRSPPHKKNNHKPDKHKTYKHKANTSPQKNKNKKPRNKTDTRTHVRQIRVALGGVAARPGAHVRARPAAAETGHRLASCKNKPKAMSTGSKLEWG